MKFVLIEPGTFLMGSDSGNADEKPVHKVTLTEGFYMQATEVTQRQWQRVMDNNPSFFKGPNLPADNVSWNDAQEFLKKLNAKEKGARYRLPSEAEWEYAARAGQAGEPPNLEAVAWNRANSGDQTHPVGQKQPNGWGLYDMLGNVWEWCADWHDSEYYANSPPVDPPGPAKGDLFRVLRGGSCVNNPGVGRVAGRSGDYPADRVSSRGDFVGFRCVREVSP
jgi:formylglycine-generating enzyme required for sulfatase activity